MYLENLNVHDNPLIIRSYNPTTFAIFEENEGGKNVVYTGSYEDCVSVMRDIEKYILKEEAYE